LWTFSTFTLDGGLVQEFLSLGFALFFSEDALTSLSAFLGWFGSTSRAAIFVGALLFIRDACTVVAANLAVSRAG
jgi:hypothetical protein